MKQPISTAEMSWPMIGLLEPSRLNLPMRGPMIRETAKRGDSSDSVHHARSGEIAVALAQAGVGAQLREPSAAPGPVAIERIGDRAHDDGGDCEGGELPPFGAGAGHDREGGVHEHHFKQEDDHDAYVIGVAAQQIPGLAEKAPGLPEQCNGMFGSQGLQAAQVAVARRSAHLYGKAE